MTDKLYKVAFKVSGQDAWEYSEIIAKNKTEALRNAPIPTRLVGKEEAKGDNFGFFARYQAFIIKRV